MLLFAIILLAACTVYADGGGNGDRFEKRCGWFSNPTPANISFYDRDAEWIIGIQGGHQVEGDWEWPAFKPKQWVKTNGNYGHGCACLEMRGDSRTHKIMAIRKASARQLKTCRQARSLKRWEELFK